MSRRWPFSRPSSRRMVNQNRSQMWNRTTSKHLYFSKFAFNHFEFCSNCVYMCVSLCVLACVCVCVCVCVCGVWWRYFSWLGYRAGIKPTLLWDVNLLSVSFLSLLKLPEHRDCISARNEQTGSPPRCVCVCVYVCVCVCVCVRVRGGYMFLHMCRRRRTLPHVCSETHFLHFMCFYRKI